MGSIEADSRSQTNAWLNHLLGNASEHAVVFLDETGRVVAWLGASERIFGYRKAEALQLELRDLFTADDRRLQLDQQEMAVARALGRSEDERWHVRKDGSVFWGSGVLATVTNPQGGVDAFCKILRDRSDLRQRLDTLQNRLQALQQDIERKTRVLETAGQQLRALLSSQAATRDRRRTPALQADEHARQLAELAAMLQDATESDEAVMVAPLAVNRSVVLQDKLKACMDRVRPAARAAGQDIHLIVPAVAIRIRMDRPALQEMLQTLLNHAIKQNRPGGRIHVTTGIEGDCAMVRVLDEGPGISVQRLSRILPFLTGAGTTIDVHDLDAELARVNQLARMAGGSLEARNRGTGKGTVLCLRLPIASG